MLAAHRDQENLVHAHQASAKQQPKTPGPKYPKTPLGRFAKNDENAPTVFGGKSNLAGTIKRPTAQKQALATPLGTHSRAPLGNKTTNAKARPKQSANGKVKPIDASQIRPGTQRPKIRQPGAAASRLDVQSDKQTANKDEEPEYAPPTPAALPYQSDVLPEGGLTFRGLKKEYLLNGYYENFYNPIDANGMSRLDKAFDDEMKAALDKAVEQHDREFEALDWGIHEAHERKANWQLRNPNSKVDAQRTKVPASSDRAAHTFNSRRAASALAIRSDNRSTSALSSRVTPAARPAVQSRVIKPSTIEPPGTTAGEAASRTTIGYSKGRTASSMMRPQHQTSKSLTRPPARQISDDSWDLTLTPARARIAIRDQSLLRSPERPQFTSIFYDNEEDSEPITLSGPAIDSDDDDEFELKLDI